MKSFKRVLCPIDFSDTSIRALHYAAAFATWYESELTVLHVAPAFNEPLAVDDDQRAPYPGGREEITARLRQTIEHAGAASIKARPEVLEGRAPKVIVEAATAMAADLLVMGTHGYSGFDRLLLGSVTQRVARTARCPVLTVPPRAIASPVPPVSFKKIVCPIDYSPSSMEALEYALELGRQAGGRVKVLSVLEYMDPEDVLEPSLFDPCREAVVEHRRRRQARLDRAREQLHHQLAGIDRTWCEIEEVVAVNRAYKEILLQADAWFADLIVMGAQGSGGVELMLYGSNTDHVVRAATCPVLTVRA